jgi:lipopolysaccharide/colanic/teichoic acid biosynthesis glycosyltransferase
VQVIMLEIPRTTMEGRYIIETCQNKGARLLIYSNLAEQLRHPLVTGHGGRAPVLHLAGGAAGGSFNRLLKRAFDISISLPVVVLALPPLVILVWLMQRLQAPGSVFHIQERTGYGHHRFRMLKFRSMYQVDRRGKIRRPAGAQG